MHGFYITDYMETDRRSQDGGNLDQSAASVNKEFRELAHESERVQRAMANTTDKVDRCMHD